ncbi:MAG: xylose isomerase, partial [Marivirga sp.]|nr:xylose isomerase [Marivirga sp.]
MKSTRREFLRTAALASAFPGIDSPSPDESVYPFSISSNSYNWFTFYRRSGETWGNDWDACMSAYAQTGLKAYEGNFSSVDEVNSLAPYLKKYAIQLPSVYVNSTLHTRADSEKSIDGVLAIA